ncbi:hypothetical protein ACWGI0_17785 [Streptomyces sp. NPDC054802]
MGEQINTGAHDGATAARNADGPVRRNRLIPVPVRVLDRPL